MASFDDESLTNVSLISQVARAPRDEAAWARFVSHYSPKVFSWARGWGLQTADAEDVTQMVLAKLARQMGRFTYDASGTFRGWLRTMTRNAWHDWVSARGSLVLAGDRSEGESLLASLAARDDLVHRLEETFDLEILNEAVLRVRGRVSEKTWNAYRLSAIEGQPAAQVADRLEMTVVSVFKAKSNVLKKIRDEVRVLDPGLADAIA